MSGEGKSSIIDYHEGSKPSTKKNRRNKRGSKKRCQKQKVTDGTKVKTFLISSEKLNIRLAG
jgi:hypothetical protein